MANSEKSKYPALRIIAAWYKAFGYVVGAILAFAGIASLFRDGGGSVAVGLIVGAVIFVILSMAVAEIIQVFMDTESNTRNSADYLKALLDMQVKERAARTPKTAKPIRQRPEPPKKATESQAQTIRALIQNLHKDGLSADEIAQELRSEGMPTMDGGDSWTAKSVEEVLSRP